MSTTTYRPTEVGNLYVGDVVSLPGDILATVTGFDFTDLHDRPGYVGLQFDGFPESRLYATTDILDVEVTTLVPSGDASNTDSITYDPAIDRFTVRDGADTQRGDRWTCRHFLHNVGFAFDTADRLLDAAVAEATRTHTKVCSALTADERFRRTLTQR